jgi:hypothetical protein
MVIDFRAVAHSFFVPLAVMTLLKTLSLYPFCQRIL